MARKCVIHVTFLDATKASLNWSLEATFVNYMSICQVQLFFSFQSSSPLQKTCEMVMCECDVFMNAIYIVHKKLDVILKPTQQILGFNDNLSFYGH